MPTMALDAIDRRILTALQADARISNAALAEAVGLANSVLNPAHISGRRKPSE